MANESVPRTTWTRELRNSELCRNDLLVLLVMATHMDSDGSGAFASVATLAAECGLGESTVRRIITRARELGWLERERRGHRRGDGSTVSSRYRTALPSTARQRAVEDDENGSQPLDSAPQPLDSAPQPLAGERLGVPLEVDHQRGEPRTDARSLDELAEALIRTPANWKRQPAPGETHEAVAELVAEFGHEAVAEALAELGAAGRTFPWASEMRRAVRGLAPRAASRQREDRTRVTVSDAPPAADREVVDEVLDAWAHLRPGRKRPA